MTIVRKNEGNCALIKHLQTGIVYETPEECIDWLRKVWLDFDQQVEQSRFNTIILAAKQYIQSNHSRQAEKEKFLAMIDAIMSKFNK